MPSSVSHSSMPPKFPDKQRRPGIIHLPQPIAINNPTPVRSTPAHKQYNGPLKPSKHHQQAAGVAVVPFAAENGNRQLRTPSPSPKRRPHQQTPATTTNSNKKRGGAGRYPLTPLLTDASAAPSPVPQFEFPKRSERKSRNDTRKSQGLISPPLTPAPESGSKKSKPSVSFVNLPKVSLASPPLSPVAKKFTHNITIAPTNLLPAFQLAAERANSSSDDSSTLDDDDDDDVILVAQTQMQTPAPTPPRHSPPPSPTLLRDWEKMKSYPRPDAQTIAWLKEEYGIRSSKPMEATPSASGFTQPIPIARPVPSHLRSPSLPNYPTSRSATLAQMHEDVAELFGLDSSDTDAVNKAAGAWRAYSGSTFSHSPEESEVEQRPKKAAPRFLGRFFH